MPLQMQSGGGLLPGSDNLTLQQRPKAVSFQTPAATSKKAKNTGRRAFGDISNRKQSHQSTQQKTDVSKVSKSSVRLERQTKTTASVQKPRAKPASSATLSSSHNTVDNRVYESIERPYGLTAQELDELYDSDSHISVCSMEKEGFVVSRQETAAMIRQALVERRLEDEKQTQALWKSLDEENMALLRQDDQFIKHSMQIQVPSSADNSFVGALHDLSMALSDDEDGLDLGIPL